MKLLRSNYLFKSCCKNEVFFLHKTIAFADLGIWNNFLICFLVPKKIEILFSNSINCCETAECCQCVHRTQYLKMLLFKCITTHHWHKKIEVDHLHMLSLSALSLYCYMPNPNSEQYFQKMDGKRSWDKEGKFNSHT